MFVVLKETACAVTYLFVEQGEYNTLYSMKEEDMSIFTTLEEAETHLKRSGYNAISGIKIVRTEDLKNEE